MPETLKPGASFIVRPGEKMEEPLLDMSGWRGRVIVMVDRDHCYVAWDSQTLREIPETAVAYWIEHGIDWTGMTIELGALLPYAVRDEVVDGLVVARERTAAYDVDFDAFTENPLYFEYVDDEGEWVDLDDWSVWEEEEDAYDYFDLDQFLHGLEIPVKEHPRVRRALSKGLGQYHYERYGRYPHGKQPAHLIPESMGEPYIFGYGAVQILKDGKISRETKLKICKYALGTMNLEVEDGIPYGILSLLAYLVEIDDLPVPVFHYVMINMEYGGVGMFRRSIWHFDVEREAVLTLLDWLAAHADIPPEEKLFWAWRWSLQAEADSYLVKAIAQNWLAQSAVPDAFKVQLCWTWMGEQEEAGTPPPVWRLMGAFMAGDQMGLEKMLAEFGVSTADLSGPLAEIMPPSVEEGEAGFMWQLLHGVHDWLPLTPAPLRRLAIPALAQLGEDPLDLVEMYWDRDKDYYTDLIHAGIADMLAEQAARLPAAELRRLVEQGLHYSRVQARKRFHLLARDLYPDEYAERYLPLALDDDASSLRTWAKKQTG